MQDYAKTTAARTETNKAAADMITLRSFTNGHMTIYNVPYVQTVNETCHGKDGNDSTACSYLTPDVIYQLSDIIRHMTAVGKSTEDYQRIMSQKRNNTSNDGSRGYLLEYPPAPEEKNDEMIRRLHVMKEPKNTTPHNEKQKDDIRKQTKEQWLDKYRSMKTTVEMSKQSFDRNTDTDAAAHTVQWLMYFHTKLQALPELERRLIEEKYLQTDNSSQYPLDEIVSNELFISLRKYYYIKKEALYLLGVALGIETTT